MQTLDKTAWEILNATADDCENLEQIYRQVCLEFSSEEYNRGGFYYRPVRGAPLLEEIADRIQRLTHAGLLSAVMDDDGSSSRSGIDPSFVWRAWFSMTPQGRLAWETSEFGNLVDQEPSR